MHGSERAGAPSGMELSPGLSERGMDAQISHRATDLGFLCSPIADTAHHFPRALEFFLFTLAGRKPGFTWLGTSYDSGWFQPWGLQG